jgi:serine/threonine-protein kinase HipA
LNISEVDSSLSLELALEVASYFRVDDEQARSIIEEVSKAIAQWREVAGSLGISRSEQELMAPAFRHCL